MQLQALGGLRLTSTTFTRPKPLLLLSYLALEGPQQRKHLAELFWSEGNRMKSLSMALTLLRQGAGEVFEADKKQVKTTLPSDVKDLLEALDKSDWEKANELYTGAFLEGIVLDDWSSELEEWVYTTREYLAERVQYALLNLAENAAKKQDFDTAATFAERAYKLPGLGGTEIANLKRLYTLLCAGNSLLAPDVRKEAESYDVKLQLTTEEAQATFRQETKTSSILPMRGTSFVGRDVELTELATELNKRNTSLVTLLGTAGVGKTRLALQLAFEQQKLGAFEDGVYFVALESLTDASLIASTLLSHLSLSQQGKTEPIEQLADFFADKSVLFVLDNFEHLTTGAMVLSLLLSNCPNLKLLVTSRETLKLEEEHVFALEGLPIPTSANDALLSDAVQLFKERARQVKPQFEVKGQLPEVIRICQLVEGLPLGIELAASWVRMMPCSDIANEIERGLELLSSTSKNIPERHRSLRAAFEYSWQLLTPKEQETLRKLAVFRDGFRREAASEVAGATIPILASLVDKSLIKVLPNGRYDFHPLLHQFAQEKLAELLSEQVSVQTNHTNFYLALAERAEPQLRGKEQIVWFQWLSEELDNFRRVLSWLEKNQEANTALKFAASLSYFWRTQGYILEGLSYMTKFLARTNGNSVTKARVLFEAGEFSWLQGDYQNARTFFEESLAVAKPINETFACSRALAGLGKIHHFNLGEPSRARLFYEASLESARANGDKTLIADTLRFFGSLEFSEGNYQQDLAMNEEAIQLYSEVEDHHSRAKALVSLATALTDMGEFDKAHALNEESLELFRAVGDRYGIGIALLNLGRDASQRQEIEREIELYQESLYTFRDIGNKNMVSHLRNNLAGCYHELGNLDKARELLEENLSDYVNLADQTLLSQAQFILGDILYEQGYAEQAYAYYQKCLELSQKTQDNWAKMRVLNALAKWHSDHHSFDRAQSMTEEGMRLAHSAGDAKTLIQLFETRASIETLTGDGIRATQLFSRAEAMRQKIGFGVTPRYQDSYRQQLETLREQLGEQAFAGAWSQGKKLSLEQMVHDSLHTPTKEVRDLARV